MDQKPPPYAEPAPGYAPPPGQPGSGYPPPGQPGSGYPPPGQPYPPPGQQYPPQPVQPPATTTVIVTGSGLGPYPANMQCPNCHQAIVTRTEMVTGTLTWLACLGLVLVGCWLGCCLIPFCVDACQDVKHSCPNCNHYIGEYKRM